MAGAHRQHRALMSPDQSDVADDAASLLWRFLAFALVIAGLLLALVVFIGAHEHAPVANDPILSNATGYGQFIEQFGSVLIVDLSCVTSNSAHEVGTSGLFQLPTSHLTIDIAVPIDSGRSFTTETIPLRQFILDESIDKFRAYFTSSPTLQLVTDAPRTTGCAGTLSPNGQLS
jgi:hypothetical protein